MNFAVAIALLFLLGLLTLVSYVDRVYQEAGKFLSREFQDNIDVFEQKVEPELGVGRTRASLSMAVLTQLTMAAIALLVGFLVFSEQSWTIYEILQAAISLILMVDSLDVDAEDSDLPGDAGDDRSGLPAIGGFSDQAEHQRTAGNVG